jgi:ribosomal protein S27AE
VPSVPERLTCDQCGYPLRGLPRDGKCPECGHSIAISAHSDSVARLERRYQQRALDALSRPMAVPFLLLVAGLGAAHLVSLATPAATARPDVFLNMPFPKTLWPVAAGTAGALIVARLGFISYASPVALALRAAAIIAASFGVGALASLLRLPGHYACILACGLGVWRLLKVDDDLPVVTLSLLLPAGVCWFVVMLR